MRYPKFIHEGDCIGFPAPSFGCNVDPYLTCFKEAPKFFEKNGFKINPGPNSTSGLGIGISNTPEKCAEELMNMYLSDENDALISCGGGELMCEILEHMDFDALKSAAPKWFMGYSDNTNFIFPMVTLCDTAGIYGRCADAFGLREVHSSVLDGFDILRGRLDKVSSYDMYQLESLRSEEDPRAPYNLTEVSLKTVYDGRTLYPAGKFTGELSFSGRLLGGCTDCLVNLVGTPFEDVSGFYDRYASDGIIWCLESCDLNVFDIRRAMWHFEKAGWFKKGLIKGFMIGRPGNGAEVLNLDHINAVMPYIEKYNCPAVIDCDLGHLPPAMTMVFGSIGHVKVDGNTLELEMEFA